MNKKENGGMHQYNIFLLFFMLLILLVCIFSQDLTGSLRGGYSVIVFKKNNKVIAEDSYGTIIMQGKVDVDDADVIQKAVYSLAPAGELKLQVVNISLANLS